jgi:hypothetical protein
VELKERIKTFLKERKLNNRKENLILEEYHVNCLRMAIMLLSMDHIRRFD